MMNHVVLDPNKHKDLKIIDKRSKEYGDDVMFAMTFPFEFRNIQSSYPIFFHKNNETGAFYPVALFGFQDGENLFLTEDGWQASYIPLMIRRQPFLIGYQKTDDSQKANAKITFDANNPRVSNSQGQRLFLEHGGRSDYLNKTIEQLESIHSGHEHSEAFIKAMLDNDLLESVAIDIKLVNGSNNQLLGFYTVDEEKVQNLNGAVLADLNEKGFLLPMFMVLASHTKIRDLIERKNKVV